MAKSNNDAKTSSVGSSLSVKIAAGEYKTQNTKSVRILAVSHIMDAIPLEVLQATEDPDFGPIDYGIIKSLQPHECLMMNGFRVYDRYKFLAPSFSIDESASASVVVDEKKMDSCCVMSFESYGFEQTITVTVETSSGSYAESVKIKSNDPFYIESSAPIRRLTLTNLGKSASMYTALTVFTGPTAAAATPQVQSAAAPASTQSK